MPTTEHQRGETVVCELTVKDVHAVMADPTTVTCTIVDSASATKVNAQNMTKDSAGNYHYSYTLAADAALGTWTITYTMADATGTAILLDTFTVVVRTT